MRAIDIVRSAIRTTFRSRLRTVLTVIAIFIGAFTLTITNGLGTGINAYIDDTVASIGADDVLTVSKTPDNVTDGGVREYKPNLVASGPHDEVEALTPTDIEELRGVDGVESAEPQLPVAVDSITYDGGKAYEFNIGSSVPGKTLQLAAGSQLDADSDAFELALPVNYVDPLGFSDAKDAIDKEVALAITDAEGTQSIVTAVIVGVAERSLGGGDGSGTANDALTTELDKVQSIGESQSDRESYAQATVVFDINSTPAEVEKLRDALTELGYDSKTVDDEIGAFKSVIDGIILTLNAFSVIALLAAGFGIVNTLLTSVQERTREIGLMKAMGLSSRKVFGLFSTEALFLGFLGSVLGSLGGIVIGSAVSGTLATSLLGDLPGLTLIAFTPVSVLSIIVLVMGIAFLAGTLPAVRAARQNPIDALRYE
jgi:putative ABC transport system permease protein